MGDQIKNMLVGLLMIAACAFTISLILFLKPSVGDGKKTYIARFSNINGIGVGTRVMFAGKPVGEVISVEEVNEARKQPSDKEGRFYFYQLKLKVDSSVTIYNTDTVGIQTSGLLGEKSIAIIPKVPVKGVAPKPIGKEIIYAQSADPLETAFTELSELASEMEGTFRYLNSWLDHNGDLLAAAIGSFKATMNEAEKTLETVNQTQVVQAAKNGIDNFSNAMERIQDSLKEMQDGKFFGNANETMADLKKTMANVSEGKGTIGKLLVDDDMYLQLSAILSKGNTLMNDINHYGVLFHLNKSWQRQRLQKVTFLDSLDTPQSFKNYFQKEVDDINLAMARLSMLIEKAGDSKNKDRILQSKQFTKDFAELLREVDQMSNNLKLYNEQFEEAKAN